MDRYDDREVIQTNLVDSYDLLMAFAAKHLPDPFYLEEDQRKSLRTIICREMIANTLIHREYTSTYQAKFVIEKNRMYVENVNRAAQNAVITPDNLEPNPKNPIIASFFRTIGLADQLGSGVRNMYRYCRVYSGEDPQFPEDDIFRIVVSLGGQNATDPDSIQVDQQVDQQADAEAHSQANGQDGTEKRILTFCETSRTRREIADFCGYKDVRYRHSYRSSS